MLANVGLLSVCRPSSGHNNISKTKQPWRVGSLNTVGIADRLLPIQILLQMLTGEWIRLTINNASFSTWHQTTALEKICL